MKHSVHSVTALSVLGTLMGCAQIVPPAPNAQAPATRSQPNLVPVKVAAGQGSPQGASGADTLFSVGRYAHAAGQLEQASQRYTQALELNPEHVGALNAMAVIHAQSDRTDEALKLFTRAIQLAPKAAHIHNNMGYALLRAGRLDEAGTELKKARELDPTSVQTAQNLDLLAKEESQRVVTINEPQPPVLTAASGVQLVPVARNVYELRLPAHQLPTVQATQAAAPSKAPLQPAYVQSDVAVVGAAAPVVVPLVAPMAIRAGAFAATPAVAEPVIVQAAKPAVESPAPAAIASAKLEPAFTHPIALVLPAVSATMAPLAASKVDKLTVSALQGVRLEVSNGVGIANLARRTAERLAPTGVFTARLTNARPYRQAKTEIQFIAGQGLSVQALQARLPATTKAVEAGRLERGVQIRLVLGHDVAGRAIAAWLDAEDASQKRLASVPPSGGWVLL